MRVEQDGKVYELPVLEAAHGRPDIPRRRGELRPAMPRHLGKTYCADCDTDPLPERPCERCMAKIRAWGPRLARGLHLVLLRRSAQIMDGQIVGWAWLAQYMPFRPKTDPLTRIPPGLDGLRATRPKLEDLEITEEQLRAYETVLE